MQDTWDDGPRPSAVKRFMVINRRAPHGSVYALEALDVVLTAGLFGQAVSVVFMDDGVYQLRAGQDPSGLGMKNFSAAFRALESYDVERLYVDRDSLLERGMSDGELLVPATVLGAAALAGLMQAQDVILSF